MTKIALISDLHLGFGKGTEREEDPFIATDRALKEAVERNVDMIVLAGDIFDSRLPRPEHWSRFMKALSVLKNGDGGEVAHVEGRENVPEETMEGIPVVAIHGTHERRGGGMKNSIEALEDGGFLVHLHCSSVKININGERIAVHGMGGVPEKYSKETMEEWNPEPFEDAYNILALHQNLREYIYNPNSPPELGLEDLPGGFDLYVSGHIHWRNRDNVNGSPFVIPGSLIPTQLRRNDFENPKGFYIAETSNDEIEFIELEPPRRFFYERIDFDGSGLTETRREIESRIEDHVDREADRSPLITLKLTGKLAEGLRPSELDISGIKESYEKGAILNISSDLRDQNAVGTTSNNSPEKNLSVDEMGMRIFRKNLEEAGSSIRPELIFEDLEKGNLDSVVESLGNEHNSEEVGTRGSEQNGNEWWKR